MWAESIATGVVACFRRGAFGAIGLLLSVGLGAQDFPSEEQLHAQQAALPATIKAMRSDLKVGLFSPRQRTQGQLSTVDIPSLPAEATAGPIRILGNVVPAGSKLKLVWHSSAMGTGDLGAPVTVINGSNPGPVLCLTGGVHGDELNGVEVVNRMLRKLEPDSLSGTVIGVPVVNVGGFQRSSRYLADRRDLNRYFPGSTGGSAASRLAHSFFHSVIRACDYLVDFHTGSFERANLPQVRGNLRLREVLEFTRFFGATTVLHSEGSRGMLRSAATEAGIPAVTFEIGGPIRLEQKEIEFGVRAIETLMNKLNMTSRLRVWTETQPVLYRSTWVRTNQGGFLLAKVGLGDKVQAGQALGLVRDPLSGSESTIMAHQPGRIIGLALNQQVMPGYAVFHLGVESSETEMMTSALKPRLYGRPSNETTDDEIDEDLGDN